MVLPLPAPAPVGNPRPLRLSYESVARILYSRLDRGHAELQSRFMRDLLRLNSELEGRTALWRVIHAAGSGGMPAPGTPEWNTFVGELRAVAAEHQVLFNAQAQETIRLASEAAARSVPAVAALAAGGGDSLRAAWNQVDPLAIEAALTQMHRPAFEQAVRNYGAQFVGAAQQVLIAGLAAGQNPRTTARRLRELVTTMPAHSAAMYTRTLQMNAYRSATAMHQRANGRVLRKQIRIAALDDRCCFLAGTMITTATGVKPIESVAPGERVLTHTGAYKRVMATMSRPYDGTAITLRTHTAGVTATANHPFLVERDGKRDWVAAESLQVGERVFVSADDLSNDGDHFGRDITVEGDVRDANNREATRNQTNGLSFVGFGPPVPVHAVHFDGEIAAWQEEVNRIAVNARLLIKRLSEGFKAKAEIALGFCFARVPAVAAWRTEFLIGHSRDNAKVIAASETGLDERRASATLRTVVTFVWFAITLFARGAKHLATAVAGQVQGVGGFAFEAAHGVPVIIGLGNPVRFPTNRADFLDSAPDVTTFGAAKAGVPLAHFGRAQLEPVAAHRAGEGDALPLIEATTSTTAIHPLRAVLGGELGSADLASMFVHDTIISSMATQIKTEVYNLEVEDDHSYAANGLVVHNCLACLALHGSELPVGEEVVDHHNGRCIGIGIPIGSDVTVQSGAEWFDGLPAERQQRIMGAANWQAWQAGRVRLDQFVGYRTDLVWGPQTVQRSLRGILGTAATQFYSRRVGG